MSKLTAPYKEIYKRDHKKFPFQIVDGNGDPYDLTDVIEIIFTVNEKDEEGADEVFACTKTLGDVVVTTPLTGMIRIDVIPEDTSTAEAGEKIYDIEVEDENNEIHTAGKGIFNIIQDTTQ